jgi:hypothetical protein
MLVSLTASQIFALTVDGTLDSAYSGIPGVSTAFNSVVGEIEDLVAGIDDSPDEFIRGFADSSAFASHGATQRAYGEYKLFAFTIGPTVGVRLPGSPFNAVEDIQNIATTLNEDGDVKAGLDVQALSGQVGINTSIFLPFDGLYLGVRFGYFNLTAVDNLDFQTFHVGAVASYQVFKGIDAGVFDWRGLTVGTGFLFQKSTLGYTYDLGKIDGGAGVTANPVLDFDMAITTYTIPVEVTTSIQVLWVLNLGLGAGVDIAFGQNDVDIAMNSGVNYSTSQIGTITVEGGGSMTPTILNPKIMANVGFKFGPVILDIPVTYYFFNGLSAGVTLGVVF